MLHFTLSSNKNYICTIKKNPRAKNLILKRNLVNELILTVPSHAKISKAFMLDFLKKNEAWILQSEKNSIQPPSELNLKALDELWSVHYPLSGNEKARLTHNEVKKEIFIEACSELSEVAKLLQKFMQKKAKNFLPQRLHELLNKHQFNDLKAQNLPYEIKVRPLKSRWGSFTSTKKLTLNSRLLLLPLELVDYVIVHELCHAYELNHSSKFYAALKEKMPNYLEYEKLIKKYAIPAFYWL